MNASDSEQIWKQQEAVVLSPEKVARITASVREIDRDFRRKIWWRDVRVIGAALVVAGFSALVGQTWFRWISVACALFVGGVLIWSRLVLRHAPDNSNVIARLHAMIRETEMQIKLLRSILWWYLLPCVIGMVALGLDHSRRFGFSKPSPSFQLTFWSTAIGLCVVGYWLNQRTVRKFLEPRRARLQQKLAELNAPSAP